MSPPPARVSALFALFTLARGRADGLLAAFDLRPGGEEGLAELIVDGAAALAVGVVRADEVTSRRDQAFFEASGTTGTDSASR